MDEVAEMMYRWSSDSSFSRLGQLCSREAGRESPKPNVLLFPSNLKEPSPGESLGSGSSWGPFVFEARGRG